MGYEDIIEKIRFITLIPDSIFPLETSEEKMKIMAEAAKYVLDDLKQLQSKNDKLQKIADDLYFAYINKDHECPHQFEIEAIKNYETLKGNKNGD